MRITVKTNSRHVSDLFTQESLDGVKVECQQPTLYRTISGDDLILIAISLIGSVSVNVLSAWIIDKIQGSNSKIYLDDKEVASDKETLSMEIKKSIERGG